MSRIAKTRIAFLLYLGFVVYGSFIPFELREYSFELALERFARIPWLELGAGSRADWIANLVLYIPLAFLGCASLASPSRSPTLLLARLVAVLSLCLGVALAVEFGQVFFEPRTVSLNDLLAEALGTLAGLALWTFGDRRLRELWHAFVSGGRSALAAVIAGYGALYVALALFPFDFVISGAELESKLDSGNQGWLVASSVTSHLRITAGLLSEALAIAPLGVVAGLLIARISLTRTFLVGCVAAVVLELAQLLLVSGLSQGASVLARGAGLTAGAVLGRYLREHGPLPIARLVKRYWLFGAPAYLLALAAASGWLSHPLLGWEAALRGLSEVRLLPFYYHYFTTEPLAMASLLANAAMYAPLGVLAWARHATIPRARRRGAGEPAGWAMLLVLPIEISKAWLGGSHPDFTNLLIGAGAAAFAYSLCGWLANASQLGDTPPASNRPQVRETRATGWQLTRPPAPYAAAALAAASLTLVGLWQFPSAPLIVAGALAAYAWLLRRDPWIWLLVLPALLPVLDLAPYTGRLLLSEFDLLVLVTLAVGYWQTMPSTPPRPAHWAYSTAVWLLSASAVWATLWGLKPALDGWPTTLSASHSALEALMVGKGLFGALLLAPLLRRIPEADLQTCRQRLVAGLAGGLVMLSLTVLWERHRFVGIGDFQSDFRVTGNFSEMYNGGAYIEAFIAIAFPALVIWTLHQTRAWLKLAGIAAAALSSYAMLVTFSRGGYAGLVVALAVVVFGVWRSSRRSGIRKAPVLAGVLAAAVAAAAPVFYGDFAQDRLARVKHDLDIRLEHWSRALSLMDSGLLTAVTGMGFGRYPSSYLWRADVAQPPGTFAVHFDQERSFIRLGAGDAYYLDQIVDIDPRQNYTLRARLRFLGDQDVLAVPVCDKALLYSFACHLVQLRRPPNTPSEQWLDLTTQLSAPALAQTDRWPAPTTKLSLAAPTGGSPVDLDTISLTDSGGREHLANGTFDDGLAHWLPATDRDLAWHIHQTALEVYFAQGLLGIAAVLTLLVASGRALLPGLMRGDGFAVAVAGGLAGFLAVGLLGSTMDAARLSMIFYLLAFSAMRPSPRPRA